MHEQFLLAALDEAKYGRGICAPNPSVGAVAVKNGKIIAKAYHKGAGQPHAEQLLIQQLNPNESGLTLYSTLEPCNHFGRTPPCVDSIVRYGFERVVFAYVDPNPTVAKNDTPTLLKNNGIDVIHYPLREVNDFYEGYQFWIKTGRPWVNIKIAQTFDGKIAGEEGERIVLSNECCERFTHEQRFVSDIILTSARTIISDNARMNVRLQQKTFAKPVAILDRELRLSTDANVFSSALHCHIFYDSSLTPPASNEKITYYPIACENRKLSLPEVLQVLGELGFHSVWMESGGTLLSEMHRKNLVQRTYCYLVPKSLGEKACSAYLSEDVLSKPKMVRWQAMEDNMMAILDWVCE